MSTSIVDRSRAGTPRSEREQIRALLLERRPDLARRLQDGPSGALLIPLPGGRAVEIGQMRRRGRARWVVVAPSADGARLREPATLQAVALSALPALRGSEQSR